MRWIAVWMFWYAGCSDGAADAERAALNARIAALEQQVQALRTAQTPRQPPPEQAAGAVPHHPFKVACPQPWLLHTPLGATLWSCRSPSVTPQGLYPQCVVTFQPQAAIETRGYFEFALNATPPLRAAARLKDQHVTLRGSEAFEAAFEASAAPVDMKLLSVLVPQRENTYAITCSAPSAVYDQLLPAFRQIIDTFGFD